ncbi:MAG: hypothetical protein [Olavius algarvensis Gamma 1 endosymbiont]|nr:MAG: hypothetical protein [Olavius algarvensis Gamma 1 endosymbiont]
MSDNPSAVQKTGNRRCPLSQLIIRVVPLDNFMIYKDIIRLDRPD